MRTKYFEQTEALKSLKELPRSIVTRRVPEDWISDLRTGVRPRAGDLVCVEVTKLGQHVTLHLPNGRKRNLFVGDRLIAVYGNRYAPDQFEARIPDSLEPCHLVASGGIVATVINAHRAMRAPTCVEPLGLICRDQGSAPVNIAEVILPEPQFDDIARIPTIAIVGTAMNAGKTTTAANLVRGLTLAGLRVGFAKVTGTGAGGDPWMLEDAGAAVVLDFVDVGYASTYKIPLAEVEEICIKLIRSLYEHAVDVIVLEVADGLYQRESAHLLHSAVGRRHFGGLLFAAADAMGAKAGADLLLKEGHKVLGVTGVLTSSPLQIKEAAKVTGQRVIMTSLLCDPVLAKRLVRMAR